MGKGRKSICDIGTPLNVEISSIDMVKQIYDEDIIYKVKWENTKSKIKKN